MMIHMLDVTDSIAIKYPINIGALFGSYTETVRVQIAKGNEETSMKNVDINF